MARNQTRTEKAAEQAHAAAFTDALFTSALPEIDLPRIATKFAIGYAYVVIGYFASWHITSMLIMTTSIAWLQYVIAFAALTACLVFLVKTTPVAADAIYEGGAWLGSKLGSLFNAAKAKVQAFRAPAEATVH